MDLMHFDANHIWHPFTQLKTATPPLLIERAEGSYLFTHDGRRYIDGIASWWVILHGHGNIAIREAISAQLAHLDQVIFAGATHEAAIRLGQALLPMLPGAMNRIFFSDNGSTAVEVAIKMAIQHWVNRGQSKQRIIAFKDSYHGDTFGAMSASGRSVFSAPFTPLLFPTLFIDPPLRSNERGRTVTQMTRLLEQHDDIAAFIYEPMVQGSGGMLMHDAAELGEVIALAKKHGVFCIADEAMTGLGRTGKLFGSDHIAPKPDIICLAKGLTGGVLPLSITACTEEVYAPFHDDVFTRALFHGHSFTANPPACAAARASLELLQQPATMQRIEQIAAEHQRFKAHLETSELAPAFNEIRHQGVVLAFEFKTAGGGYSSSMRNQMLEFFMARNLFLRPLGNVLYILPPYSTSTEDLHEIYSAVEAFAGEQL